MKLFKRKTSKYWWFKFELNGIPHCKSTKSEFNDVAQRKANEYLRKLQLEEYDLVEVRKSHNQSLFKKEVLAYVKVMQPHWKTKTREMHNTSLGLPTKKFPNGFPKLLKFFGNMNLNQIKAKQILEYQEFRSQQLTNRGTPPSGAAINRELALVRQLLDHHKLWLKVREGSKFQMMEENEDVGQALTDDQVQKLLCACRVSNSRALYPAVLLSIFTGMRSFELRHLQWERLDFLAGTLRVGKSKTKAGEGRPVDLNEHALELLKGWRGNFPNAKPTDYIFCRHQYGWRGKLTKVYPELPCGKFTEAWQVALKMAGFKCRWHDLRHTCASLLADGGASEATMLELMGWMPGKMLRRYSHSRELARKSASAHVGNWFGTTINQESQGEGVQ